MAEVGRPEHPDFTEFKSEFTRWQQRFGMTGVRVYFEHKPLSDSYAQIIHGNPDCVATVTLNSKLSKAERVNSDPKRHAKHEALHLLCSRLENLGRLRYVRSDEIYEATEELVRKLEGLIAD